MPKQPTPMTIAQIKVSNIRFGKLEVIRRTTSQRSAFIFSTDSMHRVSAIISEIITETFGIPREGP